MKKKIMRTLLVCRHVRLSGCPHHNTKCKSARQISETFTLTSGVYLLSTAQMDSRPAVEPNQLIRITKKHQIKGRGWGTKSNLYGTTIVLFSDYVTILSYTTPLFFHPRPRRRVCYMLPFRWSLCHPATQITGAGLQHLKDAFTLYKAA